MSVDLGAGNNTLTLATAINTGTVNDVETLIGGRRHRHRHAGHRGHRWQRQSRQRLRHTDARQRGANTLTVANVGSILGGGADDTVTLGAAAVNATIDLVDGVSTLTLGNFTNTATVSNAGLINGGTGNDAITLGSAL